jgi:DNA polymerase-3 subunit alpha
MGLQVLGPDVNESREMFTPVVSAPADTTALRSLGEGGLQTSPSGKIRFGLAGIKGVGELAAQKIIEEREKNGPYADFEDFASRVDARALNKRVLEHLAKTGAFDFSGASRKKIFDGIDGAMATVASTARDKAAGQHSFLDALAEEPPANGRATAAPRTHLVLDGTDDFSANERLQFEKELLGFYVSGHPMNTYAGLTDAIDTFPIGELSQQSDRTEFRLCGIVSNIAKKLSKKDNRPWAAFSLATKSASAALNMFADGYAAYGTTLVENAAVLVQGNIIVGNDGARINVKECYPLDAQVGGLVRKVTWLLHPAHPELPAFLRLLRETLNRQSGDTRVEFAFLFEDRVAPVAEASTALSWRLSAPVFQQLRAHPAVAGVQLETKRLELKQDRRWARNAR